MPCRARAAMSIPELTATPQSKEAAANQITPMTNVSLRP